MNDNRQYHNAYFENANPASLLSPSAPHSINHGGFAGSHLHMQEASEEMRNSFHNQQVSFLDYSN